jgi:hypothetical protein
MATGIGARRWAAPALAVLGLLLAGSVRRP